MKKCPYCAEGIQDEAIKCRYCGERLGDSGAQGQPSQTSPGTEAEAERKWHYAADGQRIGPLTPAEILKLLREGKIPATTLLWNPGLESWTAADSMELFRLPELASPPPLPVPSTGKETSEPEPGVATRGGAAASPPPVNMPGGNGGATAVRPERKRSLWSRLWNGEVRLWKVWWGGWILVQALRLAIGWPLGYLLGVTVTDVNLLFTSSVALEILFFSPYVLFIIICFRNIENHNQRKWLTTLATILLVLGPLVSLGNLMNDIDEIRQTLGLAPP